jgi:homoserine dehydrogenase
MPVMVPRSSVFATVDNEYNLIEVEGSAVGTLRFSGKGAGKFPTATSIMGDLVDYIQNAKIEPIIAIEDATTLATIPEPSDWVIRLKGSFDKKAILEAFSDYSPELDDLGNSYLKIANIAEAPMIKILNRFDDLDWKRYLIYEDLS